MRCVNFWETDPKRKPREAAHEETTDRAERKNYFRGLHSLSRIQDGLGCHAVAENILSGYD